MHLTNIGKNKTLITHKVWNQFKEFTTDYDVYFSYSQPVVVVDWANRKVYQNITKYSNTTTKHTKQFLRMSNRFDYDDKGNPHMIDKWQHAFVNEAKINELASAGRGI